MMTLENKRNFYVASLLPRKIKFSIALALSIAWTEPDQVH